MKLNPKLLKLALARACMNPKDAAIAANVSRSAFNSAMAGRSVSPATAGKIACGLGADIETLLAKEEA